MESPLPPIPANRYFTIGEVGDLCGVKPHVLRYWEQEFTQLRPMKRRGNRRYYQHHEVLMIRRIRELLYDQGFTISGARTRLQELDANGRSRTGLAQPPEGESEVATAVSPEENDGASDSVPQEAPALTPEQVMALTRELIEIRDLLTIAESGRSLTL